MKSNITIPAENDMLMQRFAFLLLFLPLLATGQEKEVPEKPGLVRIYTQAIGDFIHAANAANKAPFDTLFFGKRHDGTPDDFPDITLPQRIANTSIRLITPEAGTKSQNERRSRVYVNLVGWVDSARAEFIFVVFSDGFVHQYDYLINYRYSRELKTYERERLERKGPPF